MANIVCGVRYCLVFHNNQFLDLLLFNIFMYDMCYFLEEFDIVNYAGDSIPYCVDKSSEFVVSNLEQ